MAEINPSVSADVQTKTKGITPMQRRVLAGGSVGQFIEFYDLALYGISAVVLSRLFFPSGNDVASLLALFATYGVAFFIRPLGGLFFGAIGDKIGRRNVLVATLLTIGVATTAIGLLPGYNTIGVWATILLVFFRLLQGFSAGGESVGAPSFVFEHAPEHRRGLFVNITLAATALPSVVASGLTLGLSAFMAEETFYAWGWRIPFWLALPMAFIGLYIRARTEESPAFKEMFDNLEPDVKTTPIRNAFRFNWLQMIQVVFVMGLTAMGFYFLSGYFVPYVETIGDLSRNQALGMNAAAMALYTVLLPLMGSISDRIGRRPMLITGAVVIAVSAIPAFMLVTSGSVWLAVLGQFIFVIAITIYGGGCYTFFIEVFQTGSRFTAAAFSYNLGYAILGGTAPFVGEWFVAGTGVAHSPAFWVIIVAIITLLVIWLTRVPETRGNKA